MAGWQRTHNCGELRLEQAGQTVTLNGWVNNWRDHGGLAFIDIRDRYGMTQVVFDPVTSPDIHELARTLRSEHVISVTGTVAPRLEGKRKESLATGDIEVKATQLTVLNRSDPPPFEIGSESDLPSEETRLRYRFLDLRRTAMQKVILLRHELCQLTREYLNEQNFVEVETPMLGRSTPEGARDYLVPSRLQPWSFYALPQSPQLYKQILMVAGYDRYYQIARCFRDEDLRANRQPEFTQIDIEMSFVETEDILRLIEGWCVMVMDKILGRKIETPFPRLTYADAMERYGIDKPDLRFGMELVDITALAHASEFSAFRSAPCVRGFCVKEGAGKLSRKQLDELTAFVGELGARGLAWVKVEAEKLTSPIVKFFSEDQQKEMLRLLGAEPGDLLLFIADQREKTHGPLSALRNRIARDLKLYAPDSFHFAWCTQFPMFEKDDETGQFVAKHHPFTAPLDEDFDKLETAPETVRAKAYDLIVNGEEAGGGTIRLHRPDQQQRVFNMLGLGDEEAKARFGFLLEALRFGAPPHGGIALGLDRWVMQLAGLDNIRDCIAFPKTQRATDLMTGAPNQVEFKQLKELGLK